MRTLVLQKKELEKRNLKKRHLKKGTLSLGVYDDVSVSLRCRGLVSGFYLDLLLVDTMDVSHSHFPCTSIHMLGTITSLIYFSCRPSRIRRVIPQRTICASSIFW